MLRLLPLYNDPEDPNQDPNLVLTLPPVILFPGISGDSIEVKYLAREIDLSLKHKSAIFALHTDHLDSGNQKKSIDLSTIVDIIANELILKANFTPYTFQLVGYSYGCTLATLVALRLKELGHKPHVLLIDGVAPHESRKYYSSPNLKATEDIIAILNLAARFSFLKEIEVSAEQKQALFGLNYAEQFNRIQEALLRLNNNAQQTLLNRFANYVETERANLDNVMANSGAQLRTKLDVINLLLVDETANKYGTKKGGWKTYGNTINNLTSHPKINRAFAGKQHLDLVKEENCSALAEVITSTFNKEIDQQEVFEHGLNYHLNQIQKNYPGVDVRKAAKNYSSSPSPSASSDDEKNYCDAMELDSPITTRHRSSTPDRSPPEVRTPDLMSTSPDTRSPISAARNSTDNSPSVSPILSPSPQKFGLFAPTPLEMEHLRVKHVRHPYSTRGRDLERGKILGSAPRNLNPGSPKP